MQKVDQRLGRNVTGSFGQNLFAARYLPRLRSEHNPATIPGKRKRYHWEKGKRYFRGDGKKV